METTKKNLLFLVDDDKMFLKSMEHYIHHFFNQFTVKTFQTGEECLNYLHQKPDIVLLDYYLNSNYPDAITGLKVLDKIKEKTPESTVVMFSAQDHINVAVNTMKHGAFDYIVKNDKIFPRVRNVVKNILHTFSLKKDLISYRNKMGLFGALFLLMVLFVIYMQIHFQILSTI